MRGNDFLDKMELVDPSYVEAAEKGNDSVACRNGDTNAVNAGRNKRKFAWFRWAGIATCVCLLVSMAIGRSPLGPGGDETDPPSQGIMLSEEGVTIPPLKVSLNKNSESDMIGFFLYQGRCYVQYGDSFEDPGIIEEHLGHATGLIDEWTPQDGYVELAGSVKGDFYRIKGYDPDFLLGMKWPTGEIASYICNNGITMKYGYELWEERFHLSESEYTAYYETKDSWFQGRDQVYPLEETDPIVKTFLRHLNEAEFIPWEMGAPEPDSKEGSASRDELYHLYLKKPDGITIHLRMYENGYVRFDGIRDVCLRLPEEEYNDLCKFMNDSIG